MYRTEERLWNFSVLIRWDIVFTDIDMPEIDGLELMQMCKEEFPEG